MGKTLLRDELRSVSTTSGAPFVMILGMLQMLQLSVLNLGFLQKVCECQLNNRSLAVLCYRCTILIAFSMLQPRALDNRNNLTHNKFCFGFRCRCSELCSIWTRCWTHTSRQCVLHGEWVQVGWLSTTGYYKLLLQSLSWCRSCVLKWV